MKRQQTQQQSQDDPTFQITWEDQQKINTFSRLNLRFNELDKEITQIKEEINKINDASDEIFISDDINFVVGEIFVEVDTDKAEKLLENKKDGLKKDLKEKQKEYKDIENKMKELKAHLYGRFGTNINLEER
ncbi:hypothetical protein ABK040_007538 [Willaertia magna]